jgi:hypothetical protein
MDLDQSELFHSRRPEVPSKIEPWVTEMPISGRHSRPILPFVERMVRHRTVYRIAGQSEGLRDPAVWKIAIGWSKAAFLCMLIGILSKSKESFHAQ